MSQIAKTEKKTLAPKDQVADDLKKLAPALAAAVGKTVSVERFARVALTAIQKSPELMQCSKQSLYGALLDAAALALEVNSPLGHAYLIPYKGVATLVLGFKGLVMLARRSGEIANVTCRGVFEGDRFEYAYGLNQRLEHVPSQEAEASEDPGKLTHVYCVIEYRDGSKTFDVMSVAQVERVKARSRARENGPWKTDYVEMAKKTVLRRHLKTAPLSAEAARAAQLDEQVDADLPQEFIDITAEPEQPAEPEGQRMAFKGKQEEVNEPGSQG